MLEPAAAGSTQRRGHLRIGGMTVARQQLSLALTLGCERIVCIAQGLSPEVIELQHVAEAARAQFHVIPGARPLVGLITAGDELIALADGLFVSTDAAAALLEQGQAVLVQPIEAGLVAGFERIDLNQAAAGAMRLPGRLVERIADLPADCDAVSALQRIALQAGVRQRAIPALGHDRLFWTLVRNEVEAHALEPIWIRHRTADGAPLGPSRWLARLAVRGLGPALLHAGNGPVSLAIGSALALLLALGAGWLALVPVGLAFCASGWVVREGAVLLARIDSEPSFSNRLLGSSIAYGWVLDATIVALAGWGSTMERLEPALHRFFPVVMLLALLRILPHSLNPKAAAWLEDRALLAVFLAVVIAAGVGDPAIHVAAVVAALSGILLPGLASRLTRP